MVWMEKSTVTQRQEFVHLAGQDGANVRALCRQFGISPKTDYKWLNRFEQGVGGMQALHDRSRRPLSSPERSFDATEQAVLALRRQHPAWGGLQFLGEARVAVQRGAGGPGHMQAAGYLADEVALFGAVPIDQHGLAGLDQVPRIARAHGTRVRQSGSACSIAGLGEGLAFVDDMAAHVGSHAKTEQG